VARYLGRISGPLLDRIDLHVTVPALRWRDLEAPAARGGTREARERVCAARARQARRLGPLLATAGVAPLNSEIPDARLDEGVDATPDARHLLGRAVDRLGLSARAARRILRVARTVADLEDEPRVGPEAVAEALGYRPEEPSG
jgi:magnesium chelatase family protein